MKLLRIILSLVALLILGPGFKANAFSFTVEWDNPGAVIILDGGATGNPVDFDAEATSWNGTATGSYTIKPAPGYVILGVHEKYVNAITGVAVENDLKPNGSTTYGQTVNKWIGSQQDGAVYSVTTKKLAPAGSVTVDVQNGLDKIGIYLANDKSSNTDWKLSTFTRPALTKGVQEIPITENDNYLCIEAPGTVKIFSVKLNGAAQTVNRFKEYEIPVKDGDKIEIRVYEQDPEACEVSVKFTNGENCLTSIRNSSSYKTYSAEQLAEMGYKLTVDQGDDVWFYFNEDYNVEAVSVDGVSTPVTTASYKIKVEKSCAIEFTATAKVYEPVEITLYLKKAEGLIFRTGPFEEDEEIVLGEGEDLSEDVVFDNIGFTVKKGEAKKYVATVSGKRPQIFWSARPGYWVPTAKMLNPEDVTYTWPSPGVMAEYCPLYLEATEVVADHKLVIFFEGAEKEAKIFVENPAIAGRLPLQGLDEEFYVPVGYTMSAYDPSYHKSFSTGKVGGEHNKLLQVFVNGRNVSPADDGSFGLPVSGDPAVIKIFSRDAVEGQEGLEIKNRVSANNVKFEVEGACSAEVTYDKVLKHEDLSATLQAIGTTLVSMKPEEGTVVMVDGAVVEPNAEGLCEFTTSMRNHIVKLVSESGVDGIAAGESENNGKIFNLQGMEMNDDFDALPAGIYIVNGKKVIKK